MLVILIIVYGFINYDQWAIIYTEKIEIINTFAPMLGMCLLQDQIR